MFYIWNYYNNISQPYINLKKVKYLAKFHN